MARKKKHPEHENLERWLISYADFITLLFATFVVLYALSQVDIQDFKTLEDSVKNAFSAPSLMQGKDGIMQNSSDSLFNQDKADSVITPLMMEYISQKYEEQSMDEIEKTVNEATKSGGIDGVEAFQTDRGLVLRFNDDYLFKDGSAELTSDAKKKLDKIGAVVGKKFILHNIRVEGHTDNKPINSVFYPSNWELSSARASSIIRYLIGRFSFMPSLFTAVGFAETRPINDNNSAGGRAKNRRVEILILKNKFKSEEYATNEIMKMSKEAQAKMHSQRIETINRIDSLNNQSEKHHKNAEKIEVNDVILNQVYEKEVKRISKESEALDSETRSRMTGQGSWLKPPAAKKTKTD